MMAGHIVNMPKGVVGRFDYSRHSSMSGLDDAALELWLTEILKNSIHANRVEISRMSKQGKRNEPLRL